MSAAARAPRALTGLIAATTLLPLSALFWVGWELTAQDRQLQAEQGRARVERAADSVVAALQRAIAESEQRLASGAGDWPVDAIALTFATDHVAAAPSGRLPYLPALRPQIATPTHAFARAEELEFAVGDRAGAVSAYRRLAQSSDPAVRAGALLRLGRALRYSDQEGASAAYSQLGEIRGIYEGDVPVDLIARWSRCSLLDAERRGAELRNEAARLARDLAAGHWEIAAGPYAAYLADAQDWAGFQGTSSAPAALYADAAARLWAEWRQSHLPARPARGSLTIDHTVVTVLWQATQNGPRALLAGPHFVEAHWLSSAFEVAVAHGVRIWLVGGDGRPVFGDWTATLPRVPDGPTRLVTVRLEAAAGLPWALTVAADGSLEALRFAERRRLLIAGFALLGSMALIASYLITRTLRRELALARLREDLVAAVSHEFRTPLTALRQFTDMLRERPGLSEDRRRLCYDAQARATDRLSRLVESVLDFGRIEAGARAYTFEQHDAAAFARRVVEEFRRQPEADGRPIEFREAEAVSIEADAEALVRALWNLLDNAVKYSPAESPLQVTVARVGHAAAIAVTDRGIGLAPDERRALFMKFKRGERAIRRGIKGTGIGLALAHEIVRAHGGRIDVASRRDVGSTFTIVLPAKE